MKEKTFSERMGLVPEKAIQIESMDEVLKNKLWNCFYICYFRTTDKSSFTFFRQREKNNFIDFIIRIINNHFKITSDFLWENGNPYMLVNISSWLSKQLDHIKKIVLESEWFKVYEFIEFVVNYLPIGEKRDKLINEINIVLEEEKSGYRFLGSILVDITDEEEMSAIKEATTLEDKLKVVSNHLEKALKLYANRENPDYINSIKESINAVEAMAKIVSGRRNQSLGDAFKSIEKSGKIEINKNLQEAYKRIYGWASNEGIRHSKTEGEIKVYSEEAKYMIVSCSAFVNYLKEKAIRGGIKF